MTLELRNVTKRVGSETQLSDVSLTLERGSLNVLLGPTLSGKTTLLRMMAGLDAPTEGQVLVNDRDVTGTPVRRRSVAMVYQQFINYPNLTVYENIASPLRVARGIARDEIDRRVRETAALMRLDASARSLSARAFRRPAAAHGARTRDRETRRSAAARRAARQSRLQAARGIARRIAQVVRGDRCDHRLCDSGALGCVAPRRQHGDASARDASRSSARRSRSIAGPTIARRRRCSPIRR